MINNQNRTVATFDFTYFVYSHNFATSKQNPDEKFSRALLIFMKVFRVNSFHYFKYILTLINVKSSLKKRLPSNNSFFYLITCDGAITFHRIHTSMIFSSFRTPPRPDSCVHFFSHYTGDTDHPQPLSLQS